MGLIAVNGVRLHVERGGDGPPLLLLHGFTGSAATWEPLLPALQAHFHTVAPDLIGHGRSDVPADPARYAMDRCVADLVALLDALDIDRAAVLGYSMGGRTALHLALAAPERVSALVLEGASPGIADPDERAARVASDAALADRIEREGLQAFVDAWERLPLFASQQRLPEATRARLRAQRLSHTPRGLANSLRGMGAGAMAPVHDRLGEIAVPVLLIAGELDGKYVEISRAMAGAMPQATVRIIPDAGHAPHLEQPEAFVEAVLGFLVEKRERPART
ncbi:2-succinyl-6-hydroxy-2,4-cyclohexadiene-1-carboxylate synthase [Sphaerobacter thermophilus]|uniref:Putative 2-succinyl-6-hydroxy-2,4-cyclohexadiene-1-carboxylate synthase n=1 Tax=Sphaerobacter thermophilus (strain ATCC 49802 / DSM 20745 / KCCM 41009 / NCIMB 13125 / S 6022) TaxID=479434 RepID=D1C9D2_SPHTD|nr:2-succinyl-6-hydroxy-2,4-cyclohexadiene-1-carboxylate synthase [Sphaerobacter thermophilus]ACZ40425.1 alpha/beta hydrolase fold protein [Sphaerobacter thermophilus DSM 20745]